MDYRSKINKENKVRMDLHVELKDNPSYLETWKDIEEWTVIYGRNLGVKCNPGPELIWLGKNYGKNNRDIPRILFVGYNPRWDFDMGMRYSLCKIRGVNPCLNKSLREMSDEEWAIFKKGNGELSGYQSFNFVKRNYSFKKVIEIFFNVQGLKKEDTLDYIAYSNGYIYPGPDKDEKPTVPMKKYEEEKGFFKSTINLLEPEYIFVFSAEIWNSYSMWPGEWAVDRKKPIDEINFLDMGFIGLNQQTKCIAIRIPHFSHYVRKSFEPLIKKIQGKTEQSVPIDRMLRIIEQHLRNKYPNILGE
ncbi:MAG: hypothetical protein ACTSRS_01345 [Candidatus Helarchaeota archaeon]